MKKTKIPTLLGLLLILITLTSLVWVINEIRLFALSAKTVKSLENFKITNLSANSFTINWTTDKMARTFVEYQGSDGFPSQTPVSLGINHSLTIPHLKENTRYSFRVNVDGVWYYNNLDYWSVQTKGILTFDETRIISGKVLTNDNIPAAKSIVFVRSQGMEPKSTQVSESGNWVLNIPQLADSILLEITIVDGNTQRSEIKIPVNLANPVPPVNLNKNYDFTKTEKDTQEKTLPQVQISLP